MFSKGPHPAGPNSWWPPFGSPEKAVSEPGPPKPRINPPLPANPGSNRNSPVPLAPDPESPAFPGPIIPKGNLPNRMVSLQFGFGVGPKNRLTAGIPPHPGPSPFPPRFGPNPMPFEPNLSFQSFPGRITFWPAIPPGLPQRILLNGFGNGILRCSFGGPCAVAHPSIASELRTIRLASQGAPPCHPLFHTSRLPKWVPMRPGFMSLRFNS